MTDQQSRQWEETPTVEVRVFHHDGLVHTELCESEEQAALVVAQWSEFDNVRCEVGDLTVKDRPEDASEPRPAVAAGEDYPHSE